MNAHIETTQEALERCKLLWGELHRTGSPNKGRAHLAVLGYASMQSCPACDFARLNMRSNDRYICVYCPITAWCTKIVSDIAAGKRFRNAPCMQEKSPYNSWLCARTDQERSKAALGVLRLVGDSLAEFE